LELFDAYLDRRLSEADRTALNACLADSPAACRLFWEHVHQHAQLVELLAEAHGRQLAEQEQLLALCPRPKGRRMIAWLACAAAVLVAVALGWLFRPGGPAGEEGPGDSPGVARLDELRGEVHVLAETGLVPARAGQEVGPNDEVHTGEDSFAVVTYPDSSRLELNSDTAVRLLARAANQATKAGKRVFLVKGSVNATVAPQPAGRPLLLRTDQADLLVPGTRFSSANLLGETRIEVEEGKALLARKGGPAIEVRAGTYAIAATGPDLYNPGPLLPASTRPFAQFKEGSGPVMGLAALAGGAELAVACWNGQVKLWRPPADRAHAVIEAGQDRTLALARSPDGRSLAVACEAGQKKDRRWSVLVWDVNSRRLRLALPGMVRTQSLGFSTDGQSLLLVSERQRAAVVWDLPAPGQQPESRERLVLGDRAGKADCLAVSPDGRSVAVGYRDGTVRVWDTNTGRLDCELEGHGRDVKALAYTPDGQVLASGSRDGTIRLWALPAGQHLRTLTGPFTEVRSLAFSPDGTTLASGHAGVAILWSVPAGTQQSLLKAHKFAITALEFLDGGRTLATAGWDRTVKLWKLQAGGAR
jgi:WD40 repeat protein